MINLDSPIIQQGFLLSSSVAGMIIEVRDLASTEDYYRPIFRKTPGEWRKNHRGLTFVCGARRIEFVEVKEPRAFGHTSGHLGFRVKPDSLQALVDELQAKGHDVNWWREDRPTERVQSAYLSDPAGNRVQLLASNDVETLVEHAAIDVEDLEFAETLFLKVLGGKMHYQFGLSVDDRIEAKAWKEKEDPCAPWTRQIISSRVYRTEPRPRPVVQLHLDFGGTVLGLFSSPDQRKGEPPEEILNGTPRLIFQVRQDASKVFDDLSGLGLKCQCEHQSVFLRIPFGNFLELECN